jgi:hypothetical protein
MNKTLKSFVDYCEKHKELRFWQALSNWSGFYFILQTKSQTGWMNNKFIEDTYYIEDEK